MPRRIYFITHPNVLVDPAVEVPRWPLSAAGRARMTRGLAQPWVATITSIHASSEQKAIDGAEILSRHLSLPFVVDARLGENDRSSTGFRPAPEFEKVADEFFACPERSVRGWERAVDAQERIVSAVLRIAAEDSCGGAMAIVSHGAVGTLLYCYLTGKPISRQWDQPANGGGNYYPFTLQPRSAVHGWQAIDAVADPGPCTDRSDPACP